MYLSVVDGPGKRQEIEDEKAEICQELASLGWTMEATVAGLCKQHWQGSVAGEEGGEAPQG